ncbi:MAG: hypothetical protein ACE5KU_06590 [Nitrososphaerales archaeon]
MVKGEHLTQNDLLKIRSELSEELEKMSPSQREEYLEAAKDVYRGLSRMARIRELAKA